MDDETAPYPSHPLRNVPVEIMISVGRARPLVRDLLDVMDNFDRALLILIAITQYRESSTS